MPDQILMTPEGAAQALSIGRATLYRLIQTGEIRSTKIGTARRLLRTDVEAFAESAVEAGAVETQG